MPEAGSRGDEAFLKTHLSSTPRGARLGLHALQAKHAEATSPAAHDVARDRESRGILHLVDGDPEEMAALHQDFLIRVTEFFRDPDTFEALRRQVFPAMREDGTRDSRSGSGCLAVRRAKRCIRLSIELFESVGDRVASSEAQIFGTDVSEAALEKARAGSLLAQCHARRLE